jgi:hypothetical protein
VFFYLFGLTTIMFMEGVSCKFFRGFNKCGLDNCKFFCEFSMR